MLKLADQLSHDFDLEIAISGERLYFAIEDRYQFQAARYDGNLQGTEVGMTLFYTDLLAKLWALDYQDSAPEHIEGFIAHVNRQISSIYRQEWEEIPNTRLWFGAQNKGFQVADDGNSLHFARVATRVYAASSNPLDPGNEVEANTPSSLFLGWWNDHYEEVARYEPQYQRLNEIMKWSLLVSWLGEADRENQLDFLAQVEVDRSNWFPDWVKRQPNLRFQEWDAIEFHQEGYLGTETETIPILYSEPFSLFIDEVDDPWRLSGGVSLANVHLFDDIVPISSKIDDVLLRPGMASADDALGLTLRTADDIEYRFRSSSDDVVSVTSHATKQGARLRHVDSEVANQPFERIANRGLPGTGVKFETRVNGTSLGALEIGPARNGFAVGWVSRDVDAAQQLALKLSRGQPIHATLLKSSNVKAVIELSDKNGFLVKMEGSDSWVRIGVEDIPSTSVPRGWQSRVADPEEGTRNILIAWGDDVMVPLKNGGHLVSHASDNNFLSYASTDPPSGVRSVEITGNSSSISIRAEVDLETGKVYYDFDGLPQRVKDDPDLLQGLMSSSDIGKISPPPPEVLRYVPEGNPLDGLTLVENMARKNHKALAHQIAADPDAIKRMLDDEWLSRLTRVDDFLAKGKLDDALRELDGLIKIYGLTPELTLRKGMVQLELGQLKQTAATLNESAKKPLRNPEPFFDEINARMAREPEQAGNLFLAAQSADWNDALARKQVPDGKVVVVVDDNTGQTLKLHYHSDKALAGDPVDPSSIGDDRLVYVQDLPGFNNLDWSPGAAQQSLQQVVSGDLGTVIALPRGDIANFKPTRIYANGTQFNLPAEQNRPVRLPYIRFRRQLDDECENNPEEPCPGEGAEEEQVIVVIANE